MTNGVILYGPPASGKNTITTALAALDPRFALFRRLKCGPGRTDDYRMIDCPTLDTLCAAGDIVWSNDQYRATYAIDRSGLTEHLDRGTPVVHLGQPSAIAAIGAATPSTAWMIIALWCDRSLAAQRLKRRDPDDLDRRLAVWDETPNLPPPACTLNTGLVRPDDIARLIAATVLQQVPSR